MSLIANRIKTQLNRFRNWLTSIFKDEQFRQWLKFWMSYAIAKLLADLAEAILEALLRDFLRKLRY